MVNVSKIKGLMAEKSLSGVDLAKALKITPKTFYEKMKKGRFNSNEMETMTVVLDIRDPASIFFADVVSKKETKKGAS